MATRELIQRIDLTSQASTITFSNIPQDANDLVIVHSTRTNMGPINPWDPIGIAFNSDFIGANYSSRNIFGVGNASGTNNDQNVRAGFASEQTNTSNTFSNNTTYISNYSVIGSKVISTDGVTENNGTLAIACLTASTWSGTAAVSSLSLYAPNGASFIAGSSATLYKVKRGSDGVTKNQLPVIGGTITTSGGYTFHKFTSSGTLKVNQAITADVLMVAGGGGGGRLRGGGGGAGGVVFVSNQSLGVNSYSVTLGAGGTEETSGNATSFTGLTTAVGGGRGDGNLYLAGSGASGGSGGGGRGAAANSPGGAGTSGQGSAGGNQSTGNVGAAGGGGFSAAGGSSTSNGNANGGNGGSGGFYPAYTFTTSSGVNGYLAGGGGGGTGNDSPVVGIGGSGGAGGGGVGGGQNNYNGASGTANTGGGGGGGSNTPGGEYGGSGGSGIVIIRYLTPA